MAITISGTDGEGITGNVGALTAGTAQATTSGTFKDFTGIPSWAKRITVIFNGVSLNGTSNILVQLGSSTIQTSGYVSASAGTNNSTITSSAGFLILLTLAAYSATGSMTINLLTSTTYVSSHSAYLVGASIAMTGGGSVTLSGVLDRLRITSANGTDVFDAGSINILFE